MSKGASPLDLAGRSAAHLCVDMQRMFAEDTEWRTPWLDRVLPVATDIAAQHPHRTIFTRFIPPVNPEAAAGRWSSYFERWRVFARDRIDPTLLDLVEPLARFVPPAQVIDKPAFSPFHETGLHASLRRSGFDTLIITGAETDMCVLSAVLSAIDLGYLVVLPRDALCSSADETHDALMRLYETRFAQQVVVTDAAAVLSAWR